MGSAVSIDMMDGVGGIIISVVIFIIGMITIEYVIDRHYTHR
jgi:hypothetical protein